MFPLILASETSHFRTFVSCEIIFSYPCEILVPLCSESPTTRVLISTYIGTKKTLVGGRVGSQPSLSSLFFGLNLCGRSDCDTLNFGKRVSLLKIGTAAKDFSERTLAVDKPFVPKQVHKTVMTSSGQDP